MKFEEDPEVVADLKLRSRTEYDRSRSREMPTWTPPVILDRVPCRARCGAVVSWTQDAEDMFVMFNRQLASKMEPELDRTKTLFCNTCRARGAEITAANNRKQVDYIAERIRKLKAGCTSDVYRTTLDELRKAGHPDVDGLHLALLEKANAKSGKRVAKGSL